MNKIFVLFLIVSIIALSLFAGCSKIMDVFSGGGKSDELVYLSYNSPDNLVPLLNANEESKYLIELIFDGLVNKTIVDDKGRELYEWALVEKGGYKEESPENMFLITIYLRKGVRWHDGREFIADDVIYTWKAINQSDSVLKGWLNTFIEDIAPVEKNNYKVKVKLKVERSEEAFMEILSPVKILPAKYSYKGSDKKMPFNLNDGSEISKEFKWRPVGTGPYRIKERKSDVVMLEKYSDPEDEYVYYLNEPTIKNILIQVKKDPFMAVKALQGSQLGLLFDVKPESFDVLKEEPLNYQEYLPYGFYAIVYNTKRPPFKKLAFRRAVSSATNKSGLAQRFIGSARDEYINTGIFPSGSMYVQYAPENFREINPYDPAMARSYLAQSGSGTKEFRLLVSSAIEGERRIREFTRSYVRMMGDSGIRVVIDDSTAPHYYKKIRDRDFDAVFKSYPGFDHFYDFRGLFKVNGELNIWGVNDRTLVGLLQEFGTTILWEELEKITADIHSRVEEIAPACFLFSSPRRAYYSNRLGSATVHPEVGFSTVEKWKVTN